MTSRLFHDVGWPAFAYTLGLVVGCLCGGGSAERILWLVVSSVVGLAIGLFLSSFYKPETRD